MAPRDTLIGGATRGQAARSAEGPRRRARRDAALVLGARLLQNVNGFLLSIAVVHKFGLEGAGIVTIAGIGVMLQATLLTFGLPYQFAKSAVDERRRNGMGCAAAQLALLASLPLCALLGMAFGTDAREALLIGMLSLGGAFFAQTAIANALLVLQRRPLLQLCPPLGNLVGLLVAFLATDDFLVFATILTACRFAGSAAAFVGMPMSLFGIGWFVDELRSGCRYVFSEVVGLAADLASMAVASTMLGRAELGVFGLCRQLLTLGDTPLWSRLLVSYPAICAGPVTGVLALERRMLATGAGVGLLLAAAAPLLGHWVYHVPPLAVIAPVMMLCVPMRYLSGTYEMGLRALSRLAEVNAIAAVRCAAVVCMPAGISWGGLWGAVGAMLLQAAVIAAAGRFLVHGAVARARSGADSEGSRGAGRSVGREGGR